MYRGEKEGRLSPGTLSVGEGGRQGWVRVAVTQGPSGSRLQLSVALCNALSEKNRLPCLGKADVVKEAVLVFFGATSCGQQSICTTQVC